MKEKPVIILGLSFFYHDSAAALIVDGVVVRAAQEERFSRVKHDESFPIHATRFCLKDAGYTLEDVDYVVFYDKPLLKFERLLETYIDTWPKGFLSFVKAMFASLKKKLWVESHIRKTLNYEGSILFTEHHYAHAASTYYASSFNDAAIVTLDGVGEWDTATIGHGRGNTMELTHSIEFPHSLGLLYSALTYYLGFKVNSAEYKVMGLAPYGNPDNYYEQMSELIDRKQDGSFRLNMKYFAYPYGLRMTNARFDTLFGGPRRKEESEVGQREKDIAASLQKVTEEIVLDIVRHAKTLTSSKNLCLAGGVALNCVANGKIIEEKLFDQVYIQPAAGDAGGAVGAALYVYYAALKHSLKENIMPTVYLGPHYTYKDIKTFLDNDVKKYTHGKKVVYTYLEDSVLYDTVAKLIAPSNAIGWFQGRMEFGPRALGNRSIIADPRNKENWQKINLKIKFRESFRPFAPSVLKEKASEYFDLTHESPYMLLVAEVKKDTIPAVTHVDNSARIQTVDKNENTQYYRLIEAFYNLTGCPVVINTSFNVRGEPIVESPLDAFNCFLNTEMDYLVLGNYLIAKEDNKHLMEHCRTDAYLKTFSLD